MSRRKEGTPTKAERLKIEADLLDKWIQRYNLLCYSGIDEKGTLFTDRIKKLKEDDKKIIDWIIYDYNYLKPYTMYEITEFLMKEKNVAKDKCYNFFKKLVKLNLVSIYGKKGEKYVVWVYDGQELLRKNNELFEIFLNFQHFDIVKSTSILLKILGSHLDIVKICPKKEDFLQKLDGQSLNVMNGIFEFNGQSTSRHSIELSCFINGTYEKLLENESYRKKIDLDENPDKQKAEFLAGPYYIYIYIYIILKYKYITYKLPVQFARQDSNFSIPDYSSVLQILSSVFIPTQSCFSSSDIFFSVLKKIKSERLTIDFLLELLDLVNTFDQLPSEYSDFFSEDFLLKNDLNQVYYKLRILSDNTIPSKTCKNTPRIDF